MSPMRKPSAVDSIRRAAAVPHSPASERDLSPASEKSVPEHRPRKEKPTRFTLDLDRADHQFLKAYTVEVEARGASEVMRALLAELRDDPELASRVHARIWQAG